MDNKKKNRIKNLAADILVSPLTAIAAGKEMIKKFNESENGKKTIKSLKKTGYQVSEAVKKVSETEKLTKSRENVKGAVVKIGSVFTGGISKVTEFLNEVDQRAEDRMQADENDKKDIDE